MMNKKILLLGILLLAVLVILPSCGLIFDETPTEEPTKDIEAPTSEAPTTAPTEDVSENPTTAECSHVEAVIDAVDATCTEPGKTEGRMCSLCGVILVQQKDTEPTGHTETDVAGVHATCTQAGLSNGKKCSVCGTVILAQTEISALGHAWSDAYITDDDGHWQKCTREGCTQTTDSAEHTLDENSKCTVCGYGCEHADVVWETVIEATCAEMGIKNGKCSECGFVVDTVTIEKLEHTLTAPATCTTAQSCIECEDIIVAALGHTEEIIPGFAPSCMITGLSDGKKCTVCGVITVPQKGISAPGHTIVDLPEVAPTCTETGLTAGQRCSVCQIVLKWQNEIDKLPHTYTDDDDTTCDVCGEIREIPKYTISFENGTATISDTEAVQVSGKIYNLVKPGKYTLSGNMTDGQIRVTVDKYAGERVEIVLDSFTGTCSDSAVIYVVSADKVDIKLKDGTVNTLTDSATYNVPAESKPNACIYSSDDMEIKGKGTLYVYGNWNNGIGCKNDLHINNATVYVSAVKNALKGNDSVSIRGTAYVEITNANDGIKADTLATEKAGKGFVSITENAQVKISCADEGIQATEEIIITSGATVEIVMASTAYKCDNEAGVSIDDGCLIQ